MVCKLDNLVRQEMTLPRISGLASASILVMVVVGAFGGALTGLVLASVLTSQAWLAIGAAFVAVVIALIVQHVILGLHLESFSRPALSVLHVGRDGESLAGMRLVPIGAFG